MSADLSPGVACMGCPSPVSANPETRVGSAKIKIRSNGGKAKALRDFQFNVKTSVIHAPG
jgi:hypothetical protein